MREVIPVKKKTYAVLSKIPLASLVVDAVCKPVMLCSPGIADGIYDDLREYMKAHPDILITEKLAKQIRSGKSK